MALHFAYQFPEPCERLVLVDAGGLGREVNWILRLITLPGFGYVMPEMWRSYKSLTEAESRHAFVRTMRSVIDPGGQSVSAVDRLCLTAHMPTLIVWGDHDRIIPLDHAYLAHEAIPQQQVGGDGGGGSLKLPR